MIGIVRYMKTIYKQTILTMAALFLAAFNTKAVVFTNLYNFSALVSATNRDGASPYAGLFWSSNFLYGTAYQGGTNGNGTVFKVNADGTGFTNLHNFSVLVSATNYDGVNPFASLVFSSNSLYGTTQQGGKNGNGAIFKVNTDGTGFTNLYSFSKLAFGTNSDGYFISSGMVLSSNAITLYGTAELGGTNGNGSVFRINTDGTSFTNLHSFTFTSIIGNTNTDGANPVAKLTLSGNTLYGTTYGGGGGGNGAVFKVNTDGTGFTNFYNFTSIINNNTNTDGANPQAVLVLSGNTLFGTTQHGGSGGEGTVFKVNTDGTQFTNLYSFTALLSAKNSDGANPKAGLVLLGNALYGTTPLGGSGGQGTVFKVNNDGTQFTNLYNFTALNNNTNSDGAAPTADLTLSGNSLYGTTPMGGSGGSGTLFALILPLPNLNIQLISSAAVLTWTNSNFTLQTAPVVTGSYTNIPGANSPYTNAIIGSQKFFRLQAN